MPAVYLLPRWMQRTFSRFFQYLILSVIVLLIVVPIVMLVFAALKTRGEVMSHPYTPPIPIRWENIQSILGGTVFWGMLRNSLVVMLVVTAGVVVICSLAAFVFARMEFKGKNWVFNLFTLGLMFPINVAILPVYFVLRQMDQAGLNVIDSLWG